LCAGIFDPRSWTQNTNRVTLEITRIVLAIGLFAIGVELPKSYMYRHVKGLFALVVPTMAIGWVIVAALLKVLFSRFDFITCLALAACLTPTDPIISAAITGGKFAKKHVPLNIRHILSAESAANDGLAYPFLSISLYLTLEPNRRKDITDWVLVGWLYQVILGTFIGAVIGVVFSWIMKISHKRGYMDRESYISQYIALAIFTIGVVNSIGSDDLLAAFAAGCAISWDGDFNAHTEDEAFASIIEYILNCGCFFYIGAWLPWNDFDMPDLGINPWRLVVLSIGILALRRIPAILALYKLVPEIASWKEALFCGHFGPMGIGAIFISTLAIHRLPEPRNPPETQQDVLATVLHPVVSFVVLVSIIIHGLSIPFFNAGINLHQHTLTFTNTIGTRTRTLVSAVQPPDWLLSVRRSPAGTPLPVHQSNTALPRVPPAAVTTDEITGSPITPAVASASSSTAPNRSHVAPIDRAGRNKRDGPTTSDTDSNLSDAQYGDIDSKPPTPEIDELGAHIASAQ
ncbi:hypothetical protein P691DRAFT_805903, partial [Macrolepiota fuliginosa MF-IS2]